MGHSTTLGRCCPSWASLVAQLVKNLPAMEETWIRSLGWEDPLGKGKATHPSSLAWRSPRIVWSIIGSQRVGHDWATFTHSLPIIVPSLYRISATQPRSSVFKKKSRQRILAFCQRRASSEGDASVFFGWSQRISQAGDSSSRLLSRSYTHTQWHATNQIMFIF